MVNILSGVIRRDNAGKDQTGTCFVTCSLDSNGKIRSVQFPQTSFSTFVYLINRVRNLNCGLGAFTILNDGVVIRRFLGHLFGRLLFDCFFLILDIRGLILSFLFYGGGRVWASNGQGTVCLCVFGHFPTRVLIPHGPFRF